MALPLLPLVLAGTGAVLVYEKAGDWFDDWRGVQRVPVTYPNIGQPVPTGGGAGGVVLIGALLIGAAFYLKGRS